MIPYQDLSLDVFDSIAGFNVKCDNPAIECFDHVLNSIVNFEREDKCRFGLDIVLAQKVPIFELLTSKYQSLLI